MLSIAPVESCANWVAQEKAPRLTARRDAASVARLGRIVRELSADRRIRIGSDTLPTDVIHVIGAIGRALLALNLCRVGLRSLGAGPLRGPIFGLRKNRSGGQSNQGHRRKTVTRG